MRHSGSDEQEGSEKRKDGGGRRGCLAGIEAQAEASAFASAKGVDGISSASAVGPSILVHPTIRHPELRTDHRFRELTSLHARTYTVFPELPTASEENDAERNSSGLRSEPCKASFAQLNTLPSRWARCRQ